jgi:hypothetical protein
MLVKIESKRKILPEKNPIKSKKGNIVVANLVVISGPRYDLRKEQKKNQNLLAFCEWDAVGFLFYGGRVDRCVCCAPINRFI